MTLPVVLSFGMGLDGSVILGEWATNPNSRDFDLADDLIVVTAQTGGESQQTKQQIEQHILPLLCKHRIRLIQIARAGPSYRDGYIVLDDSRSPTTLHIAGQRTLYDEMIESGTVPQYASGKRICSDKYKGEPIRWLLRDMLGTQPFRYVFGFAADEERRIAKALQHEDSNTIAGRMEFPLQLWGFDRVACAARSLIWWDEVISRSCCSFCPFAETSGGTSEMLARYRTYPCEAATTILLEHVSLALNPRATLYPGGRRIRDIVRADGNSAAWSQYEQAISTMPWAVYHVERLYRAPRLTHRRLTILGQGDAFSMREALQSIAAQRGMLLEIHDEDVTPRIYIRQRAVGFPAAEEMIVIAPAAARAKSGPGFAAHWARYTQQLSLPLE